MTIRNSQHPKKKCTTDNDEVFFIRENNEIMLFSFPFRSQIDQGSKNKGKMCKHQTNCCQVAGVDYVKSSRPCWLTEMKLTILFVLFSTKRKKNCTVIHYMFDALSHLPTINKAECLKQDTATKQPGWT